MNSFKAVQRAIQSEIQRQIGMVERGERIVQETRLWHEAEGTTHPMRSKEDCHDYRYFPEPDLVPLQIGRQWVEEIKRQLPELPEVLASVMSNNAVCLLMTLMFWSKPKS